MGFFTIAATALAATAQSSSDDGLTAAEIVANIPHDGPSIVLYVMIIGSVILVWRAGRSKPHGRTGPPTAPDA